MREDAQLHLATVCPLVTDCIIGAATDLVKNIPRDLLYGQKMNSLLSVSSANQAHNAVCECLTANCTPSNI